ncbi:MAG: ABC transporter ATP-binding protein [Aestuariivirga sp.]
MTHLEVQNLDARHGQLKAVKGVSFALSRGEILALVGANGAGKSTMLRTIAGAHKASGGKLNFNGSDISQKSSFQRVALGLALVPEGRKLFQEMSVEENLLLGSISKRPGNWSVDKIFEAFPILVKLRHARAGNLSGGEQQATAIGRALMSNPDVLMLDEISLGLSPAAVDLVYIAMQKLIDRGTTIILVEQDLSRAMSFANRVICMLEGQIVLDRPAKGLSREDITSAYFGKNRQTPKGMH